MTVNKVLEIAQSYLNVQKYSAQHKAIIDAYNKVQPVPMGYLVKYADDWCDAFVTHVFDKAGQSNLIGRECSVERHKAIWKSKGIWLGLKRPQKGDLVSFHWGGQRNGFANHIGIVYAVNGDTITTIEGNTGYPQSYVGKRTYVWNASVIQGYARPKYGTTQNATTKTDEQLADEVLLGLHGNGEQRKASLGSRFNAVQAIINKRLQTSTGTPKIALKLGNDTLSVDDMKSIQKYCKQHNISVAFMVTMLSLESGWGHSTVGKTDNNWGGFTMPGNMNALTRPSGVQVTRGLARPVNEGGYYMHFANTDDFFKDLFWLFRKGGSYKVAEGNSFETYVKGMFKYGGATYDYAMVGVQGNDLVASEKRYREYLIRMASRLNQIKQANDLDQYEVVKNDDKIVVKKDDYEVTINGVTYRLEKVK